LIDAIQPEVEFSAVEVELEANGSGSGGFEGLRLDQGVVGGRVGEIPTLLDDTN
jgi:hypothetical protein